jgi:hypothetical protein
MTSTSNICCGITIPCVGITPDSPKKKNDPPVGHQVSLHLSVPTVGKHDRIAGRQGEKKILSELTMTRAFQLSIVENKPICSKYWEDSLEKKALIGVKMCGEKLLVKSEYEYTEPIIKIYRSGNEYIIITCNKIYIVSTDIPTRKIS